MRLCLFGKHTYGFVQNLRDDFTAQSQDNDNDYNKDVRVQVCERKCTGCNKTSRFQREITISNTYTSPKWKKIR